MPKFQAVLESRENEQKRYVSLSKVPCHECDNDPLKARYCDACHGSRDEPATQKTARAFLERMEQEYVEFRLDEQRTHDRYPSVARHDVRFPGGGARLASRRRATSSTSRTRT
jgi:hypothetical protein